MKVSTLFLIIFVLFACNPEKFKTSSRIESHLIEDGLHGDVKQYKTTVYSALDKFGEITKGEINEVIILDYNKTGNRTEWKVYDKSGNLKNRWEYKYDNKEYLVEEIRYSSTGELIMRIKNNLDKEGRKNGWVRFDENGEVVNTHTTRQLDNIRQICHA